MPVLEESSQMGEGERIELETVKALAVRLKSIVGAAPSGKLARSAKMYPALAILTKLLSELDRAKSHRLRKSRAALDFLACFNRCEATSETDVARRLVAAAEPLDRLILMLGKGLASDRPEQEPAA